MVARKKIEQTASPARNFTLTTAERVAAMAGPPAWSLRLRRIEDLETQLVDALVELGRATGAAPRALPPELEAAVARLNRLVRAHNAYYPIEANLPSDPRTGDVLDGEEPWQPMPLRTVELLLERALLVLSR